MLMELIMAGLLALEDYVATHVLTCLVPAFMLAGAMVAFINQEAILNYLGEKANKVKSFSLACVARSSPCPAACSTAVPTWAWPSLSSGSPRRRTSCP